MCVGLSALRVRADLGHPALESCEKQISSIGVERSFIPRLGTCKPLSELTCQAGWGYRLKVYTPLETRQRVCDWTRAEGRTRGKKRQEGREHTVKPHRSAFRDDYPDTLVLHLTGMRSQLNSGSRHVNHESPLDAGWRGRFSSTSMPDEFSEREKEKGVCLYNLIFPDKKVF